MLTGGDGRLSLVVSRWIDFESQTFSQCGNSRKVNFVFPLFIKNLIVVTPAWLKVINIVSLAPKEEVIAFLSIKVIVLSATDQDVVSLKANEVILPVARGKFKFFDIDLGIDLFELCFDGVIRGAH